MTNEEAKKMLKAKLECFKNETSGINHDCNMRLCDGCSLNYEQGNMGEQKEALDMAIKALEQTSWIPVSERLPEKQGWYLVTDATGGMVMTEYSFFVPQDGEMEEPYWDYTNVVAWMPLPEPFQPPTMMCEED